MNINSGEIQDILTGSLLETSDDETRDVGIQVDENKGAIVNITNKDIIKTEKINLNTPEGYHYSQEIDKEKYLKTIREKELLNKSVRSLSPASDSDSSIKRRTGLRTDKGVVHTELPITKRIRKPKDMSEMDIDKATTLIPVCTGAKNLSEFINTCDIAVKSVDKNNLPLLIKIIKSKLAGNALEATKYRDTEKWEDIKSILKGAFEHRASERTLTIGLNFARMEENESITSFASRVEELYYNLCTEGSKDMSEEESRVYKKQLKNQALIIFVNGLPKHLNLALKARDPKTLETAMQFAKDEEMEHNANLQMEKLTKNIKNQNLNGNNNTLGNNVNQNNNNQNFNRGYNNNYGGQNNGYNNNNFRRNYIQRREKKHIYHVKEVITPKRGRPSKEIENNIEKKRKLGTKKGEVAPTKDVRLDGIQHWPIDRTTKTRFAPSYTTSRDPWAMAERAGLGAVV
ncbi:hypothetical protein QTP88_014375 [Uroleucon formosanum]